MFDGDGGDGAGATSADAGQNEGVVYTPKNLKGNSALSNVVYGKQDTAAAEPEKTAEPKEAPKPEDRLKEYQKALDTYKDLDDARVQNIVQKRIAKYKDTEAKYNEISPVLDMLGKKYGVKGDDMAALRKAIEEDDSYYEDEAMELGISVKQLKEVKKVQRENEALQRQLNEQATKEKVAQDYAKWMDQARQAQQIYPTLDIRAEINNQQFADLLRAGIDVRTAYEVVHKDEIIPQAMRIAADKAAQNVTTKIMANGQRPVENGAGNKATVVTKSDVSALTKADRDEIARRVARGEKITFG
jgi:hypothetical protein